ncbi:seipin [Anabrus simplex]|uniref:seipin n=1 Tax=Anabrus simplex TaxID=316456 RepID=UPI0034DCE813
MAGFRFLGQVIEDYKQRTLHRVYNVRDVVFRGGIVAVVASVILWVAVFLYVAFYYAYMPALTHSRPVHLQFKSCEEDKGICSFPSAHVKLTRKQHLLMVGQSYKFLLNLEMPESPANKRLGMFMACIQLRDKGGTLVSHSCRSGMLHYRSKLLHFLSTMVFSPMLVFGSSEEKQTLTMELFSDFEEDQNHPVTDIYVEIQTRHIELYSATLNINAHFTGLRYLMFHWPLLSAVVGISSNLFFIVLICALSWWHLNKEASEEPAPYLYGKLERRKELEEYRKDGSHLKSESDESSFEDASFSEELAKVKRELGKIASGSEPRQFIKELTRSDSFDLVGEQSEC